MPPSSDAPLLSRLRHADPDRFFCTIFAPPDKREALALLYLFNHELARAREVASEPVLALIRLQWWREVVEGERKKHDIATPLSAALEAGWFEPEDLAGLITARMAEADDIADFPAFLAYARGTGGRLARMAGKWLGADSPEVEDLGTAYAIAGILRARAYHARQGRSLLPVDGTAPDILAAHAEKLLTIQPPRLALPAALPAAFARRDLARPTEVPHARSLWDRLAVLRSALTGRV
ncbi:squalene/phytoene synthase family protein [Acidocella sp.]|uniref:squalene/phytoene synthase family protein n=1 Tax=Acidocella sp. TaxID=50710 RepID=UPI002610CB31|nr:squalene/phytoene synthase family protein [Acidocella sp.]